MLVALYASAPYLAAFETTQYRSPMLNAADFIHKTLVRNDVSVALIDAAKTSYPPIKPHLIVPSLPITAC